MVGRHHERKAEMPRIEESPVSSRLFRSSFTTGLFGMERLEGAVAMAGFGIGGADLALHRGPGDGLIAGPLVALFALALGIVKVQGVSLARLIGRLSAYSARQLGPRGEVADPTAMGAIAFKVAFPRSPYIEGESGRAEHARRFTTFLDSLARSDRQAPVALLSASRRAGGPSSDRRGAAEAQETSYTDELDELEREMMAGDCGPESFIVLLPASRGVAKAAIADARRAAPELFLHRLRSGDAEVLASLPRDGRIRERFSGLSAAGEKIVVYSVARWPHAASPGVFARLLLAPSTRFLVVTLLEPVAPERLARSVRNQRTRLEADARLGAEMGYMRGAERRLLGRALKEAELEVMAGRSAVLISALVLSWQRPGERDRLPAAFEMNGIYLRREFGRQAAALREVLELVGG